MLELLFGGTHISGIKSRSLKEGGILQNAGPALKTPCRVVWSSSGASVDCKNFIDTSSFMPGPPHLNTPQAPQIQHTQDCTQCFSAPMLPHISCIPGSVNGPGTHARDPGVLTDALHSSPPKSVLSSPRSLALSPQCPDFIFSLPDRT